MDRQTWLEALTIAGRRAPDREGRDDLAQDLAVAALERGEGVERVGAWLERVGRNAAIDRWRVERRRQELAGEIQPPAEGVDPEAALIARERRRSVRAAVGALPRAQRQVAVLRFHGDLSFEAVAARLGTEPVTARTRLHRALAALRERLRELRAVLPPLPGWGGASLWPAAQTAAFALALVSTEAVGMRPSPMAISSPLATDGTSVRPRGMARARTIAAEAAADTEGSSAVRSADDGVRRGRRGSVGVPPPSVFVFGDDLVAGDVVGPDGEKVEVVPPATHSSLIEIRRHFVAEMVKSLEEL